MRWSKDEWQNRNKCEEAPVHLFAFVCLWEDSWTEVLGCKSDLWEELQRCRSVKLQRKRGKDYVLHWRQWHKFESMGSCKKGGEIFSIEDEQKIHWVDEENFVNWGFPEVIQTKGYYERKMRRIMLPQDISKKCSWKRILHSWESLVLKISTSLQSSLIFEFVISPSHWTQGKSVNFPSLTTLG